MARVSSTHHVLGVPHLLGQLWYGEGAILLGAPRGQWSEPNHEEVETWEGDQVHSKLPEVRIQLTREAKAARNTTHGCRDKVVEITNCTHTKKQCYRTCLYLYRNNKQIMIVAYYSRILRQ